MTLLARARQGRLASLSVAVDFVGKRTWTSEGQARDRKTVTVHRANRVLRSAVAIAATGGSGGSESDKWRNKTKI